MECILCSFPCCRAAEDLPPTPSFCWCLCVRQMYNMCVYVHSQRSEEGIGCPSLSLSTLFPLDKAVSESEARLVTCKIQQSSSFHLPQHYGYRCTLEILMWVPGIQTELLMLLQPTLLLMDPAPQPFRGVFEKPCLLYKSPNENLVHLLGTHWILSVSDILCASVKMGKRWRCGYQIYRPSTSKGRIRWPQDVVEAANSSDITSRQSNGQSVHSGHSIHCLLDLEQASIPY